MRVYISSHDTNAANELAATLTAAGHEIVSTWHTEGGSKLPLTEATEWGFRADRNFQRIASANALVVIASSERVPGGKFVEAGYAMALVHDARDEAYGRGDEGAPKVRVYTLGKVENGMMHAGNQVDDTPALIAALEETR